MQPHHLFQIFMVMNSWNFVKLELWFDEFMDWHSIVDCFWPNFQGFIPMKIELIIDVVGMDTIPNDFI